MNNTLKRYLISSGVTFVSAFLLIVATNFSVETLDTSAIVALLIMAVRAGVKATSEYLTKQL